MSALNLRQFFASATLLLSSLPTIACTCIPDRTQGFIELITTTGTVVYGSISRYVQATPQRPGRFLAMEVEVKEVFRGTPTAKVITVYGDNGRLCRPYVQQFPVGSEWVLHLRNTDESGALGEFSISNCGIYWLPVSNGNVRGKVLGENTVELPVCEFREMFLPTSAPNNPTQQTGRQLRCQPTADLPCCSPTPHTDKP